MKLSVLPFILYLTFITVLNSNDDKATVKSMTTTLFLFEHFLVNTAVGKRY